MPTIAEKLCKKYKLKNANSYNITPFMEIGSILTEKHNAEEHKLKEKGAVYVFSDHSTILMDIINFRFLNETAENFPLICELVKMYE